MPDPTARPHEFELNGVPVFSGYLDSIRQAEIVAAVREICKAAPLQQYETGRGRRMSVRMTAAGRFGWVSDRRGYRYAQEHPSGVAWPAIPVPILRVWNDLSGSARQPECCLVNFYGEGARMGLHRDEDEADPAEPVVSISLGDDGLFRVGGTERGGRTRSVWLRSGDAVKLAGASRLTYHGVDRIRFGSSTLLRRGGRLNLTLRVVT